MIVGERPVQQQLSTIMCSATIGKVENCLATDWRTHHLPWSDGLSAHRQYQTRSSLPGFRQKDMAKYLSKLQHLTDDPLLSKAHQAVWASHGPSQGGVNNGDYEGLWEARGSYEESEVAA